MANSCPRGTQKNVRKDSPGRTARGGFWEKEELGWVDGRLMRAGIEKKKKESIDNEPGKRVRSFKKTKEKGKSGATNPKVRWQRAST